MALESALWLALRTMEDRAALCRHSAKLAHGRGHERTATRYRGLAEEATAASRLMRSALEQTRPPMIASEAGRQADGGLGESASGSTQSSGQWRDVIEQDPGIETLAVTRQAAPDGPHDRQVARE